MNRMILCYFYSEALLSTVITMGHKTRKGDVYYEFKIRKNMNQINQNEWDQVPVPMDLILNEKTAGSINYILLGLRYTLKSIVKEAVEEVIQEENYKVQDDDKTLTAKELCARWNICPNTLRSWEIDKRIAPLPLYGRKKIYSMKDVLAAEAQGYIKKII